MANRLEKTRKILHPSAKKSAGIFSARTIKFLIYYK